MALVKLVAFATFWLAVAQSQNLIGCKAYMTQAFHVYYRISYDKNVTLTGLFLARMSGPFPYSRTSHRCLPCSTPLRQRIHAESCHGRICCIPDYP